MKLSLGSKIEVFCIYGIHDEGILIENTDEQVVIELEDKSKVIFLNPKTNIVSIWVQNETKSSTSEDTDVDLGRYQKESLRAKSLAELHKMKAHEERRRALEVLRAKSIAAAPEVEFGTPNFTKPIPDHPKKKTR